LSNSKSWLITLSSASPDATENVRAAIDLALAAGAFGQQVTLVLCAGALDLAAKSASQHEQIHQLLGAAPFYDIEQIFLLGCDEISDADLRDDLHFARLTPDQWRLSEQAADIALNY
jgi:hypothetical protein